MNPFDLRGPEFLFFYLLFASAVLVAAWFFRRRTEGGAAPKMALDPYTIAYLRGGKNETLRVAMMSLIDRGLLTASSTKVARSPHADSAAVRHPVEKLLLQTFASAREATAAFADASLEEACAPYESTLEEHDLLPTLPTTTRRLIIFVASLCLLIGVGGTKINLAFERGHHNVVFLAIMVFVAVTISKGACFPRQTARGKAMLEDLATLYAGLKARAASIKPGGATIDALILAAIFGLTLLPAGGFGYVQTLFPRATKDGSSSGCGSSCGSSCGGGGCGGGCGGCGS